MLNKKKVAAVIAIPIIIILLIVVIVVIQNNGESKVAKLYNKLESSKEYIFEMKDTNNYEITIAKKDGQTSIDMNNDGERVTTLIKDGATYLISHSQKEYYIYDSSITNETVVTDMLKDLEKPNNTGTEKIYGDNYKYEEYTGFAGFMTSTKIDIDETTVKTRFYFKGENLSYIKTIIEGGDDELLETSLSYDVPDTLFEIPSDYAETSY